MKKLLSAIAIVLLATVDTYAQQDKPKYDVSFGNINQLKTLSQPIRDSLITEIKKANSSMKNTPTTQFNGMPATGKMASAGKKFYKEVTAMLIQALQNPDEAHIAKSMAKFNKMQAQFAFDMDMLSEQMSYEEERKSIIDDFKNDTYDDSKERSEARKDMNEELRDLKKDHDEEMKEKRKDRREELSDEA